MWVIILQVSVLVSVLVVILVSLFGCLMMCRLYRQYGDRHYVFAALFYLIYCLGWMCDLVGNFLAGFGMPELGTKVAAYVYSVSVLSGPLLVLTVVDIYFPRYRRWLIALILSISVMVGTFDFFLTNEETFEFVKGIIYPASDSFQMGVLMFPYTVFAILVMFGAFRRYRREQNVSDVFVGLTGVSIFMVTFWGALITMTEQSWPIVAIVAQSAVTIGVLLVGLIGFRNPDREIRRKPMLYIRSSIGLKAQIYAAGIIVSVIFAVCITSSAAVMKILDGRAIEFHDSIVAREAADYGQLVAGGGWRIESAVSDTQSDEEKVAMTYSLSVISTDGIFFSGHGDMSSVEPYRSFMIQSAEMSDGTADGKLPNGINYGIAAIRDVDSRTVVAYVVSADDLSQREAVTVYVGALIIMVSIILGIAILALLQVFLRFIIYPVVQLAEAAKRVQGGDYSIRLAGKSPDEIGRASLAFNKMAGTIGQRTDELNEKIREQRDLLNYVAHEMKTPVTAVRWGLELVSESVKSGGKDSSIVEDALNANDRLLALVNDLLEVSRLDRGAISVKSEPLDVTATVDRAIRELDSVAKRSKVTVDWIAPDEGSFPRVMADQKRLIQILTNVIGNSVKYSRTSGRVNVTVGAVDESGPIGRPGKYVRFKVQDWGIGIPESQQADIFKRFYRASNAVKGEIEGTGLGLNMTKQLVEMQGGEMWFESVEEEGSTFMFTIPQI